MKLTCARCHDFYHKTSNFICSYCQVTSDIHTIMITYTICVYYMSLLHFNNVPNIPDELVFGLTGTTLLLGRLTMHRYAIER